MAEATFIYMETWRKTLYNDGVGWEGISNSEAIYYV